jgi:hypothetical protein
VTVVLLDIKSDLRFFNNLKKHLLAATNLFQTSTLISLSFVAVDPKNVKVSTLSNV